MRIYLLLLFIAILLSCSKEKRLAEVNDFPSHMTLSLVEKKVHLYNVNQADLLFRSSNTGFFWSSSSTLEVEILNDDIEVFAEVKIDTIYRDPITTGSVDTFEIHNRDTGQIFYKLDTILLAEGFKLSELENKRPATTSFRNLMIDRKRREQHNYENQPYDLEYGALARTDNAYVGFRNKKNDDIFFVEIEGRYTLLSLVRMD